MDHSQQELRHFTTDETGVTLIEYAAAASLIAIVCIASLAAFGTELLTLYTKVCNEVTDAIANAPAC